MISRIPSFDLSRRNTFRMRVRCALFVELTEEEDLVRLDWEALPQPLFVMGGGSNLLFTGDFPGTVLHFAAAGTGSDGRVHPRTRAGGGARWMRVPPGRSTPCHVTVPAGTVFDDFCAWAAAEGLWGPENLSLIPGECGASAVQNIGAYGVEVRDILAGIRAYDRQTGSFVDIDPADCAYGYRTSRFKTEWKGRYIITAVTYRLSRCPRPRLDYGGLREALEPCGTTPLTPLAIREAILAIRRRKLPDPAEVGSAGSFFCNPVIRAEHFARIVAAARTGHGPDYDVPHYDTPDGVKVPAAWLIEQCGLKGHRLGGAQVYPAQPLVIVNESGTASPDDILALENTVIQAVRTRFGITLRPEVEHI